ncbi:DUF262 domain-containing protein [Tenacibaculum ovolyticum]|uniref:DUF262 domain-containing protein n=1 Tax=Tenacibaculum ovolyticum TaxID=104270 RepID=UPI0022F3F3B5|nr:DUF262 domain-containing protein [Tenacibaculum ovolyticum]WBX78134.1 DUF262 domain-containing protein [Tenacibaculum ovolyticum]
MNVELKTNTGELILLTPYKMDDLIIDGSPVYELMDINNHQWMTLSISNNKFKIKDKAAELSDSNNNFQDVLDNLYIEILEAEQSGTELDSDNIEEFEPFNPEDIKVHAKQFSLRLISDMIDDKDIDLSPDFQRNFVWNSFQKSRLIESILLRIPLPMFYFSEDNEGRITIVDGLQRLTTIKEFMNNEFPLKNLEYLSETCENRYFKNDGIKIGLDSKYVRWFNQTQFSVNVIDPSSPSKVKYDIFRRINTGGKPLNSQEIRNCLASNNFRRTLREMIQLPEFSSATDGSIRSRRMEDHEVASRFILFSSLEKYLLYSGYMDSSLDVLTEHLSTRPYEELEKFISLFSNGMKNAEYLFGRRHAFRKIKFNDILPGAKKKLINKALFTVWSVLLSKYSPELVKEKNESLALLKPLASRIEEDEDLLNYLSYGTNGRNNILYTFHACESIIKENLIT